jgi:hypothetical protein
MWTPSRIASSLSSLALAMMLVWSPNTAVVNACSCLGPITFNNALRSDATAAKVRIRNEIFPNGPLDPIGNGFRYFRATILQPYRACKLSRNQDILVSTGGNSALCGIDIKPGTDYLFFGFQEVEEIKGLGKRNVLQVGSCSFNVPFRTVTTEQKGRLAKFSYVDNCRPKPCDNEKKCGPRPPVAPPIACPDGSETFTDITCVVAPATSYGPSQCRWDVRSSSCPACSEDADCFFNTFCSAGLCRTKGMCGVQADCWNPSNVADTTTTTTKNDPPCIAEVRECVSGTCDSSCCPEKDVFNCFADPCSVLVKPAHTCVSDFCGGCNAYAFDKEGNQVN